MAIVGEISRAGRLHSSMGHSSMGRSLRGRRAMSGFTLVELLVVIAIIGVLVSLLVVALGVARSAVQESAMVTEVNSMSLALRSLSTDKGVDYPPDFSLRVSPTAQRQSIDRFLGRIFRYRNPQTDVPRQPGGGPQPQILEQLDPAEALYFWLRGFTNDPQNPLFGPLGANPELIQRSPLFEFDKARLLDKDNDGWLEYYPRFAQERPYIYYAHYNYKFNFAKAPADLIYYIGTVAGSQLPAPRPYLSTLAAAEPNPMLQNHYAAPDTFQIICAGMDNDFGLQVGNASLVDYLPFCYPTGPYPDKLHRDNITNFAEQTLEDALP
jgi:prepilin-type N-terminal cleavage/methylation domain-containing protein